ncbi:hypothetical protein [Candidatus Harpocratesius sp.]
MKNYAIAQWILFGVSIIFTIILNIFMLTSFNSEFFDLMQNGNLGEVDFLIVPLIIVIAGIFLMIGVIIFLFVRYIQYLIQLKETCTVSENPKLLGHYKNEIRALILNILSPFIIIIAFFTIFIPFATNLLAMIQPIYIYMGDPDMSQPMYGFAISILIFFLLFVIFLIVLVTFKILSALRLDEWAEELQAQFGESMTLIKNGTNLIKWGVIISIIPFLNSISTIVILIGYTNTSSAIVNTFATENFAMGSRPMVSSNTTHSPHTSGETTMPNSGQTYSRSSTAVKQLGYNLCPFCGAPLPSDDAKFCGTCGNAVK